MDRDCKHDLRVKLGPDGSKMRGGGGGEFWSQLADRAEQYLEKPARSVRRREVIDDDRVSLAEYECTARANVDAANSGRPAAAREHNAYVPRLETVRRQDHAEAKGRLVKLTGRAGA